MFVFLCLSHFTYCDNLQVCPCCYKGFPDDSHSKISVYNRGDSDLSTGSGRSPGEGKGYPLQYSCLKNPMDRGARHVVIESHTTELLTLSCCYKWRYCILLWPGHVGSGLRPLMLPTSKTNGEQGTPSNWLLLRCDRWVFCFIFPSTFTLSPLPILFLSFLPPYIDIYWTLAV